MKSILKLNYPSLPMAQIGNPLRYRPWALYNLNLLFNLRQTDLCGCGEQGSPLHYATACPPTSCSHLKNQQKNSLLYGGKE
ncbi:hypothetical protein AVEN_35153-1 [Araneus ventricosus]|uniref:Uncharacterized protein n=1 Tax=Araneus ventricosus TaxID=182803 RepID=A0A4Y2HC46_ARAVE|nr:hypothetical protein AVEN_35153-1 [Araneus ventricosus]